MKKPSKKLRLTRQTMQCLTDVRLVEAQGGFITTEPTAPTNDVRCPTGRTG
jgi:hypothetical protein